MYATIDREAEDRVKAIIAVNEGRAPRAANVVAPAAAVASGASIGNAHLAAIRLR